MQTAGISLQKLFRKCLQQTADNQNGKWNTRKYGSGIVDVEALLSNTPETVITKPIKAPKSSGTSSGSEDSSKPNNEDVGKRLVKLLTRRLNDKSQASGYENEINNIILLNPTRNGIFEKFESQDNERLAELFYDLNRNMMSQTLRDTLNQVIGKS